MGRNINLTSRLLDETEYSNWDDYVDNSPQGSIFSYSWYLKSVTSFDFKILVVENNSGQIVAGMPLPFYSTGVIQKHPLLQHTGILFPPVIEICNNKRMHSEKVSTVAAIKFLKDNLLSYRMYFNNGYTWWLPFYWEGFTQSTRYTYRINLSNLPNRTIDFFNNNVKYDIKKTQRDVQVREGNDLESLYRLSSMVFSRQGLKIPYTYDLLFNLDNNLLINNQRLLLEAYYKGKLIACNYFVYDTDVAYYLMSGVLPEYRTLQSQTLLIYEAINFFRDKLTWFDFEGSMKENIEKHFRKLGGLPTRYFEIRGGPWN